MEIEFINCERIRLDRAGFDFIFYYRVSGSPNIRRFHSVFNDLKGSPSSKENTNLFVKRCFKSVLSYFKHYWDMYQELPNEGKEYHEDRDLICPTEEAEDWKLHKLFLN
jgi:hypothetical protein